MKQKVLLGTANVGKIAYFHQLFSDTEFELIGLDDTIDTPPEYGRDVKENAIEKSKYYYEKTGVPSISADSGLYFHGVSEEEQPGLYVRRVGDTHAERTDEEMITYYTNLVEKYGGKITGDWLTAIAFTNHRGTFYYEYKDPSIFVSTPCEARHKGLPLASIQLDADEKTYRADRFNGEIKYAFDEALKDFILSHCK